MADGCVTGFRSERWVSPRWWHRSIILGHREDPTAEGLAGRVVSCLPFAGGHKDATAMGKIIDAIGEAECALRLK